MAHEISSFTLFFLSLCLFLLLPSPTFAHSPPHLPFPLPHPTFGDTPHPMLHQSYTPPLASKQPHIPILPPQRPHTPPPPSQQSHTSPITIQSFLFIASNPIVEQICNNTKDLLFCKNLAKGDLINIKKVDDNNQTMRILKNVEDISSTSKDHISQDLTCHDITLEVKCALETCLSSYTQVVASLKISSPCPDVKILDQAFKNADQSLWNCTEAMKKVTTDDPPIAYLKVSNNMIHYFISFGITRTNYILHPTPPTSETNWGYTLKSLPPLPYTPPLPQLSYTLPQPSQQSNTPLLPQKPNTPPPPPQSLTFPPSQQSHTSPQTIQSFSTIANSSIVEQICHYTRDLIFCKSLAKGNLSSIKRVYDNNQTVRILQNVEDIASISKDHISQDLIYRNINAEIKCALETCLSSYAQAIESLKISSSHPNVKILNQAFKNADQSLWNCTEAVKKITGDDLPIAYVKVSNQMIHYFISFGVTRTNYILHPTPPTSETNWGYTPNLLPQLQYTPPPPPHQPHTPLPLQKLHTPPPPKESLTSPPSQQSYTSPLTIQSFSSIANNSIVEQICHHTRDPLFCKSLAKGDLSNIKKINDNNQTIRILKNLEDITTTSKDRISQDLTCRNINVQVKCALETCLSFYTQALESLKISSLSIDVKSLDQAFKNADQSLWNCKEAVKKVAEDIPPIVYVKVANYLIHYFISFGITRTNYILHPTPPTSEMNWGYIG